MTSKLNENTPTLSGMCEPKKRMVNRLLRLYSLKKQTECCSILPIEQAVIERIDIDKKIKTCRDALYLYDFRRNVAECLLRMAGLTSDEANDVVRKGISIKDAGRMLELNIEKTGGQTIAALPIDLVISVARSFTRQLRRSKEDKGKEILEFPKHIRR